MLKSLPMNIFYTYLFIILSTLGATFLGSIFPYIFKNINKNVSSFFSSFSLGIIISMLFIEILPEGIEHTTEYFTDNTKGILVSLGIALVSGILFFILHELTHRFTHHHDEDKEDAESCNDHGHVEELMHHHESTISSALIFLFAIFIHNIPEGLALGSAFDSTSFPINGLLMSISLFIHNLIIGYSMSLSFKNGGASKSKGIILTSLSSLSSLIFGILGFYLSSFNFSDLTNGIIFSIATGSLIYVIFIELLPQIYYEYKTKFTFLYLLLGIIIGAGILLI